MTSDSSGLLARAATALDTTLDRTVAPGFSALGYAVRRRLSSWPADPAPDALRGRVAVVTGASSGLGVETAAWLGRLGAQVHLVVRDRARGEQVADELRARAAADGHTGDGAPGFPVWTCDVSDLTSVRAVADQLRAAVPRLDVLVHNAGALPAERQESAQGHELTMALHVLGPVLLTEQLRAPLTAGADPARVILVTSGGMYAQRLRADDPEFRDGDYHGPSAYARSKRAQVELLPVLQDRWGGHGVAVYATHPGWADTPGVSSSLPVFRRLTGPFLRDVHAGADTTVWLAAVEPARAGGGLWHDRRRRPTHLSRRTRTPDSERAALWTWVAEQTGLGERPSRG